MTNSQGVTIGGEATGALCPRPHLQAALNCKQHKLQLFTEICSSKILMINNLNMSPPYNFGLGLAGANGGPTSSTGYGLLHQGRECGAR